MAGGKRMGLATTDEEGAVIAENRQIIFSKMALLEAVLMQLKKLQQKIPVGKIEGIDVQDGDAVTATLRLRDLHTNKVHDLPVAPEVLAAGLIAFCADHRIPVPRRAAKSLRMIDGQVALILELPPRSARLQRREAPHMG